MDVLLTAIAPAFSLLFGDMQFAPLRQRAAADQLKAEGQGAGFHAGKCADLEPHAGNPPRAGLLRLLFNNFQRPLAEGDFVHSRLRIAMRLLCNNDARMKSSWQSMSMSTPRGCHRHVASAEFDTKT